ncbi:MAG: c-type cytochrome [bacterium]
MNNILYGIALTGAILFSAAGALVLWALRSGKKPVRQGALVLIPLLGSITLGAMWAAQADFRANDTLFWARLMSGDVSTFWALGSLGLIAGSGLALGALSLQDKAKGIFLGAIAFALSWYVVYLHPTPHYVPIPPGIDRELADNLAWFALMVGGAVFCVLVYLKFQPYLKVFEIPVTLIAGVFPLLGILVPVSCVMAGRPLDLAALDARARIDALGCLSCHTIGGVGFSHPGEGLESVASRKEDTLRAFLLDPSADSAKRLGIRESPLGEMAGLRLSEEQVTLVMEALKSLFPMQPPSKLGPGWERVETVLTEKTCLACHTLKGEGAPDGGIGGPLENAAHFSEAVLVEWLKEPSAAKAIELKIRESPMGAMTTFALPEDLAKEVAAWLQTLGEPPAKP